MCSNQCCSPQEQASGSCNHKLANTTCDTSPAYKPAFCNVFSPSTQPQEKENLWRLKTWGKPMFSVRSFQPQGVTKDAETGTLLWCHNQGHFKGEINRSMAFRFTSSASSSSSSATSSGARAAAQVAADARAPQHNNSSALVPTGLQQVPMACTCFLQTVLP